MKMVMIVTVIVTRKVVMIVMERVVIINKIKLINNRNLKGDKEIIKNHNKMKLVILVHHYHQNQNNQSNQNNHSTNPDTHLIL